MSVVKAVSSDGRPLRAIVLGVNDHPRALATVRSLGRAGIPVVGSDAGGLPEVVKHAESGYLLPVGDTEGLAERCCEILRDKERRKEMGEGARRRAQSLFGAERVVGEFEDLYAGLK